MSSSILLLYYLLSYSPPPLLYLLATSFPPNIFVIPIILYSTPIKSIYFPPYRAHTILFIDFQSSISLSPLAPLAPQIQTSCYSLHFDPFSLHFSITLFHNRFSSPSIIPLHRFIHLPSPPLSIPFAFSTPIPFYSIPTISPSPSPQNHNHYSFSPFHP